MRIKDYIVSESVDIEIPFFDVDTMDVTWHGHYIKYFEIARCALLNKIGYNYQDMKKSGYAWPVVELRTKFIKPTVFSQKITVEAFLAEYECRMKIQYVIKDKLTQEKLTAGYTIQVAIDMNKQQLCYSTPSVFTDKVSTFL